MVVVVAVAVVAVMVVVPLPLLGMVTLLASQLLIQSKVRFDPYV
jgi:hypothetical protein